MLLLTLVGVLFGAVFGSAVTARFLVPRSIKTYRSAKKELAQAPEVVRTLAKNRVEALSDEVSESSESARHARTIAAARARAREVQG